MTISLSPGTVHFHRVVVCVCLADGSSLLAVNGCQRVASRSFYTETLIQGKNIQVVVIGFIFVWMFQSKQVIDATI